MLGFMQTLLDDLVPEARRAFLYTVVAFALFRRSATSLLITFDFDL